MLLPLTDNVTVIPTGSGGVNEFGDAEMTEGQAVTIKGFVEPLSATENESGRDLAETTFTLFTGPCAALTARSLVEWDGDRYAVIGEPKSFKALMGGPHHLETVIRRTNGG